MKNQKSIKSERIFGTVTSLPGVKITGTGKTMATCQVVSHVKTNKEQEPAGTEKKWHTLVAWGKTANMLELNFSIGRKIAVECQESIYTYTDKNGSFKEAKVFTVKKILYLGEKKVPVIKVNTDC